MKKIVSKNILYLLLFFIFNLFTEEAQQKCSCNHSKMVQYALAIQKNIINKVDSIPVKVKKIVADGVIKAEDAYYATRENFFNGLNYLVDVFSSIVNWAHEIKEE